MRYGDGNAAMVAAYATGACSYREIAEHFHVHLVTVGRIVRKWIQQCENRPLALEERNRSEPPPPYT